MHAQLSGDEKAAAGCRTQLQVALDITVRTSDSGRYLFHVHVVIQTLDLEIGLPKENRYPNVNQGDPIKV